METKILNRAWRAYQSAEGAEAEQPQLKRSGVRVVGGLHYVVLHGERRVLAAYRVKRRTGQLRRLRRWPMELSRP